MKKLLFLILCFAVPAMAQDLTPIKFKNGTSIKWYNESGTEVTVVRGGDTIVTEWFDNSYDETELSLLVQQGDTMRANFYYQFGNGFASTNFDAREKGIYAAGAEALSTLQDSISSLGVHDGVLTGAGVRVAPNEITGSTNLAYNPGEGSDSVITNTFQAGAVNRAAASVRFVVIYYGGSVPEEGPNGSNLTKATVRQRRKN